MYILYISYMRVRCKPIIWITECVLVVSLYLSLLLQIGLGFFWSFHKGIVCIVYNTQRVIVSSFYFVYITILYIYAECWTANTFFFFLFSSSVFVIVWVLRLGDAQSTWHMYYEYTFRVRVRVASVENGYIKGNTHTDTHTYAQYWLLLLFLLSHTYRCNKRFWWEREWVVKHLSECDCMCPMWVVYAITRVCTTHRESSKTICDCGRTKKKRRAIACMCTKCTRTRFWPLVTVLCGHLPRGDRAVCNQQNCLNA